MINNALTDKTVRIFDKMFDYIHNQNVSFLLYNGKEMPEYNKMFKQGVLELKELPLTYKVRYADSLKDFARDAKMVVFTLLTNNLGISDVSYQFDNIANIARVKYKRDIFQIFFNCHYTSIKDMTGVYLDAMHRAITNRYPNQ